MQYNTSQACFILHLHMVLLAAAARLHPAGRTRPTRWLYRQQSTIDLILTLHCPNSYLLQAETFQNTTIIIVMDVAHHPRDSDLVEKVGPKLIDGV